MDVSQAAVSLKVGPDEVLTLTDRTTKEKVADHSKEAAKDILFGSTAGVVGKFIEYPFDTVKVRLQSQPDGLSLLYKGPIDCFKQSFRQDGFFGLYRGISAPLVGAAVETSSLFFSVSMEL
jgi:ornithine carrier protein